MSDTVYVGSVDRGRMDWQVRRNGQPFDPAPSLEVWRHSPDGFAWGYHGSGPAQLALALLLDVGTDADEAVRLHQRFKREVVATWPQDGDWRLTSDEIREWMIQEYAR